MNKLPRVILRKEAIRQGLSKYFTGKPCKRGHLAERPVATKLCVECKKALRLENIARYLHIERGSSLRHRTSRTNFTKEWRKQNRDHVKFYNHQYKVINIDRIRAYDQEQRRLYPWKNKLKVQRRRAKRINATPVWANRNAIKDFYEKCPQYYVVDHVIPLNHPLICGLHVEGNFQYLTTEANLKKSNKFEPYFELMQE